MKYIRFFGTLDLWYIKNNINPETNKFYHPLRIFRLFNRSEISEQFGAIIQKGALHWCMGN